MAATTAGALKAYLEGAGLGLPVYRDRPPDGQALPYVTVAEQLLLVVDRDGDLADPTAVHTCAETVQVDLWQAWRNPTTGAVVESYTLPTALTRALRRCTGLPAAPTRVHGLLIESAVRLLEQNDNVVHHAVTVVVRRTL